MQELTIGIKLHKRVVISSRHSEPRRLGYNAFVSLVFCFAILISRNPVAASHTIRMTIRIDLVFTVTLLDMANTATIAMKIQFEISVSIGRPGVICVMANYVYATTNGSSRKFAKS